jgi:threonylcarbamoyladenosine tRNA methylthiotransferase MtaB
MQARRALMEKNKKVAFYTLGCKLNFSETSTISRMFEEKGYEKVDFYDTPDIFIINTCSVTDNADKKCRKVVKEARKISPDPYIAIIGCYAQLKPQEIVEIPGVDAVLGAAEKFRLIDLLDGFTKPEQPRILASEIEAVDGFNKSYSINDRTRTFLKVQDGCDYSCSFCTIPLARGHSRSDTIENVLQNVSDIAADDVKEIVLTGVNTGDFGIRNGKREDRFIDLVKALDAQDSGIQRYRISSIEPNLLTNEIIEFVAHSDKFVHHFHMPLQSGCNKILKAMRRRYLRELYAERVKKIKSLMPDACIGVDVIVGFPGETEEDFLETYQFLNELDISYLHVFPYSERANTVATEMPGVVSMKERQRRSRMLRNLSVKKRRYLYDQHLGKTMKVLFENDVDNGLMHGFTRNYIRVAVPFDPLWINEIRNVKLGEINDSGNVVATEVLAASDPAPTF